MWRLRRIRKIKWPEKITNEEVIECIREKRKFQTNIHRRKVNWIGHILRRNCLLHDSNEKQATKMKK